jgi:hypothetical protein
LANSCKNTCELGGKTTKEMSKILIIEDEAAISKSTSLKQFRRKTISIMEDAEDGAAGP